MRPPDTLVEALLTATLEFAVAIPTCPVALWRSHNRPRQLTSYAATTSPAYLVRPSARCDQWTRKAFTAALEQRRVAPAPMHGDCLWSLGRRRHAKRNHRRLSIQQGCLFDRQQTACRVRRTLLLEEFPLTSERLRGGCWVWSRTVRRGGEPLARTTTLRSPLLIQITRRLITPLRVNSRARLGHLRRAANKAGAGHIYALPALPR